MKRLLLGLILRGVAFDFRVKAQARHKPLWNRAFFAGSLLASLSQGWMLGSYILGFAEGWMAFGFSMLTGIFTVSAYALIGACWRRAGDLALGADRSARGGAGSWVRLGSRRPVRPGGWRSRGSWRCRGGRRACGPSAQAQRHRQRR